MDAALLFKRIWGDRFDWDSEHHRDTPNRFANMLRDLTHQEPFKFTTFESDSDEMVIVKDIDFHSLCAHHIVPFIGRAHVAYIPNGKLVGISKIARTIRFHAADLTVQEELTQTIAKDLAEHLEPVGVAVVMEAEHMCMTLRGVKAPGAKTITSCMLGAFADHDKQARSEFLSLIKD